MRFQSPDFRRLSDNPEYTDEKSVKPRLDRKRANTYVESMAAKRKKLYSGKLWPRLAARLGREGRALIAVSGGIDSLAMLHLVLPPEPEQRKRLVVGYVHHGTGEYADSAREHVRKTAASIRLELLVRRVSIDEILRRESGFEAEARRVRYEALEEMREEAGCSLILTGNNLDDKAEGVMLSLFRGAGAGGLAGVRQQRGVLWRPLLHFKHDELAQFLKDIDVSHIEDPSNRDLRFSRNKVRHKLKPFIESEFGKGAWRNLARSAQRLEFTEAALEAETDKAMKKVLIKRKPLWLLIDNKALLLYLQELRVRLLVRCWTLAGGAENGDNYLPRTAVRKLLGILHGHPGNSCILPGGVTARLTDQGLVLDGASRAGSVIWELPGTIILADETRLEAKRSPTGEFRGISSQPGRVEYVDADITGDRLVVRPWREGDRFEPLGSPGKMMKVVRIIGGASRSQGPLWVAEADGVIRYIPGHRISHECRVRPDSSRLWRLTCIPPDDLPIEKRE